MCFPQPVVHWLLIQFLMIHIQMLVVNYIYSSLCTAAEQHCMLSSHHVNEEIQADASADQECGSSQQCCIAA